MVKVRCKQTNVDSFLGSFLYDQKLSRRNHFLRKLSEVVNWNRFTGKLFAISRVKGKQVKPTIIPAWC